MLENRTPYHTIEGSPVKGQFGEGDPPQRPPEA